MKKTTEETPAAPLADEGARSFSRFVEMLDDGALHARLSDALRDLGGTLSQHAADTGSAKGTLDLKIGIAFADGVAEVRADFKVTPPKQKPGKTVLWLTPGNNFTPENPKQMRLPIRTVVGGGDKVREVAEEPRKVREA